MSFSSSCTEDQLYTDRAPDGQRSLHITLQLITKQGCKSLLVKVDPGADVNTIPLSHCKTLFPKHLTRMVTSNRMPLEVPLALGPHMMTLQNSS